MPRPAPVACLLGTACLDGFCGVHKLDVRLAHGRVDHAFHGRKELPHSLVDQDAPQLRHGTTKHAGWCHGIATDCQPMLDERVRGHKHLGPPCRTAHGVLRMFSNGPCLPRACLPKSMVLPPTILIPASASSAAEAPLQRQPEQQTASAQAAAAGESQRGGQAQRIGLIASFACCSL